VQISKLIPLNGSNQLNVANIPIGLNGFVDGSTNLALANWTSLQNVTSTNTTQTFFVMTNGFSQNLPLISPGGGGSASNFVFNTAQFYRLHFPYAWTWP
jgi:hypothetical protein